MLRGTILSRNTGYICEEKPENLMEMLKTTFIYLKGLRSGGNTRKFDVIELYLGGY